MGNDAAASAVSFQRVTQRATVSFAQLRRVSLGRDASREADAAARALLVALGLHAHQLAFGHAFALRSGADLRPASATATWLGSTGDETCDIGGAEATRDLLGAARTHAESAGVPLDGWGQPPMMLRPGDALLPYATRMDEAGALPITGGSVVRSAPAVLRPPPTPSRLAARFPAHHRLSGAPLPHRSAACGAGEGLPCSRRHLPCVPRPLRREVHWGCSRFMTPSMAFAPIPRARLLLCPPQGWLASRRGRLRLMLRTAWSLPHNGLSTSGFGPDRFQSDPPTCYRASWQLPGPDSHRLATTSMSPGLVTSSR